MDEDLITQTVALPGGPISLLQPAESAGLPDDGGVEWAPLVPYSSVLWRSGIALARAAAAVMPAGKRVVELGCGLGAPSIAAARAGANVLATDEDAEALELVGRSAALNGVEVETLTVAWERPDELVRRGPFDLVLAADVLYDEASVAPLLALLPRLGRECLLVDPGRRPAARFAAAAAGRWDIGTERDGVVRVHRLVLRG